MTYAIQALERSHPEVFGEKGGYGRAFGLLNTAFALGGMVGPGFSGFVVAQCGWTTLCLGMSALCAVNVTLVVYLPSLLLTAFANGFRSWLLLEVVSLLRIEAVRAEVVGVDTGLVRSSCA